MGKVTLVACMKITVYHMSLVVSREKLERINNYMRGPLIVVI